MMHESDGEVWQDKYNKQVLQQHSGSGSVTSPTKKERIWSRDRQRFMMFLYFWGSIIIYSSRTAMALCMPELYDHFNWDKKQQGLVLSCFLWGYPVTQVLGGYLSDRFGAERVILTAACGWSWITFLTPFFPYVGSGSQHSSLALIIFSRLSQGLIQGMHYPSVMSAVGQHCNEKERTFVYSVISAGSHGGTLFTGLVGSIILENYGWEAVFHFIGVLAMVWLCVLYLYGDYRNGNVITVKEHKPSVDGKTSQSLPWCKVLSSPPFWAMLVGHFAQGYTFFVVLFWLPTFFHENFPDAKPWVYNVLPWVVDMASSVIVGNFASIMLRKGYSKTFTRKSLNIFAMLGFGMCLISVSYTTTFGGTLLLFCVGTAGHGAYHSTIIMNPTDITPQHSGFMFGIMNTFGAIPGFIGTYISGAILESTGNWSLMYAVTGWVCITGWAFFGYYGSGEPII